MIGKTCCRRRMRTLNGIGQSSADREMTGPYILSKTHGEWGQFHPCLRKITFDPNGQLDSTATSMRLNPVRRNRISNFSKKDLWRQRRNQCQFGSSTFQYTSPQLTIIYLMWIRYGHLNAKLNFEIKIGFYLVLSFDRSFFAFGRRHADFQFLYSVPSRVWTPSSPLSCNFCRLRDDFDDDGQLDSTAPKARSARSNPIHLEVCEDLESISKSAKVAWQRLRGCSHSRWTECSWIMRG